MIHWPVQLKDCGLVVRCYSREKLPVQWNSGPSQHICRDVCGATNRELTKYVEDVNFGEMANAIKGKK